MEGNALFQRRKKHELVVMLFLAMLFLCPKVSSRSDREALMSIKSSFSDSSNAVLDWNDDDRDFCLWRGVLCDNSRVSALNLSNLNIGGEISSAIGDLRNLNSMDFSRNNISGSIPASLGDLKHLLFVDLSFNHLSGEIPAEFGHLQNVAALILNNNNLRGKIPYQLGNCCSLTTLNVSYNGLSGLVPRKSCSCFSPDSFIGNHLSCGNWIKSTDKPNMPTSLRGQVFLYALVAALAAMFLLICILVLLLLFICDGKKVEISVRLLHRRSLNHHE